MVYRIIFFFITLFLIACEGKKEDIPSYLHIEKIGLKTNYPIEGSNSSKITDAKVFVNDQIIGVFELPVDVPILESGLVNLKISPVIKNNGVSNDRIVYPFYNDFNASINLTPGIVNAFPPLFNTTNQNGVNFPVVEYFQNSYSFSIEDFEIGNLDSIEGSDVNIQRTFIDSLVFEGLVSGKINVNETNPHFLVTNFEEVKINKNFKVYLELNYRTNCTVYVGIYETFPGFSKIYQGKGINKSEEWNKIYIELTNEVNSAVNGTKFKFYLEGDKPEESDGYLYLDNAKLIYLKDE